MLNNYGNNLSLEKINSNSFNIYINDDLLLNHIIINNNISYDDVYLDKIKKFFTFNPYVWKCTLIFYDKKELEVDYDIFKEKKFHLTFILCYQ